MAMAAERQNGKDEQDWTGVNIVDQTLIPMTLTQYRSPAVQLVNGYGQLKADTTYGYEVTIRNIDTSVFNQFLCWTGGGGIALITERVADSVEPVTYSGTFKTPTNPSKDMSVLNLYRRPIGTAGSEPHPTVESLKIYEI